MINDFVVDLETLDVGPSAAIVAIGAVAVDKDAGHVADEFYRVVDLATIEQYGSTVGLSTVRWWLRQSADAQAALFGEDVTTVPIKTALRNLADWMEGHCDVRTARVWGNGAAFDCVILREAYRAVFGVDTASGHVRAPWLWWNDRCYRTLKSVLADIPEPAFEGVRHHALDDAQHEAEHLLQLFEASRQTGF